MTGSDPTFVAAAPAAADLAQHETVSLALVPHRSLPPAGLWLFLAAQGLAMGAFAAAAAWSGNVLAPFFALLEFGVVAFCLQRVRRASAEGGEIVRIGPSRIDVLRMCDGVPLAQFHPYWVRLSLQPGRWRGWPSRLLLGSHGRTVEVGVFLNEAERCALARRLAGLLAKAGGGADGLSNFDAR